MLTKIFKNPRDIHSISTNSLACHYAQFIDHCQLLGIPYAPYKESSPTFDDLILDCMPHICGECPTPIFDRILEVSLLYPYTKRAILALLAFPISMLDSSAHDEAVTVLQLVARFCLCNGYDIIFDIDAVRCTTVDELTPEHLSEIVKFVKFY